MRECYKNAGRGIQQATLSNTSLLIWHFNLFVVDLVDDIVRGLAIDCATHALRSTENLLHSTLQVLRQRLETHRSRNLNNLIERNVASMFDVLLLFAVTRGLLERTDDEGGGGGNHGDGGLTVLDGEFDGYP